ncbi:MAG: nucleotidyl transferase AbiEii/AbiGii toxin family protein [Candidatus Marinimicrobia bacterium]|nr:nucleotidyl transferase AbiEii/AbiGii toxin family protein [Candidatus Neomarinimicrobiota bacterium]
MLSYEILTDLSKELKIDRERITREFYEILLLNELSKERFSRNIAFKGGTALRLVYQSPRFSDELDFSIINEIKVKDVFGFVNKVSKKFALKIVDRHEKRNTIIAEFSIHEDILPQNFRLKIEISKRIINENDCELKILTSPTSPYQVLMKVVKIDNILKAKKAAFSVRKQARDIFDIWFIAQKINLPFENMLIPNEFKDLNEKIVGNTLKKYLPKNWQIAIDEIITIIKKNR